MRRLSIQFYGKIAMSIFLACALFITPWVNNLTPSIENVFAQSVSTCLNPVDIPLEDLHWVYVPHNVTELETQEDYFFLAGQLIAVDTVDAKWCPSGGLQMNGYANACGMSLAKPTVLAIQNMLNQSILDSWKNVGVPPVLLKQMIRYESQFWPSRYNLTHYGFGHLTNIGIRNALQWNPRLYDQFCQHNPDGDCSSDTALADRILSALVATCSSCEYGIDPVAADRTVEFLAEALLGYCFQTAQLVFNATGWYSNLVVDYPTIWKLTLMNYNAGSQCVFDAIGSAFDETQGPMKWSNIVAHTDGNQCSRGAKYANDITAKYFNFPLQ